MSATAPSLSIVIPVLNEAEALPRLLVQLASARQRGAEVIVVDGGSRDGTADLARPLADRVVEDMPGRAAQLRAGVDAAHGDVLWLLHADSDIDGQSDQHLLWGLAHSGRGWGRFSARLDSTDPRLWLVARMMNLRSRLTGICTGDQGIFVRRDWLQRIGGIPQQALMEDIELSRRLKAIGPPLCLLKRITTSARRWEHHGVWRTIGLMWRLRWAYWRGADPERLAARYRASDDART